MATGYVRWEEGTGGPVSFDSLLLMDGVEQRGPPPSSSSVGQMQDRGWQWDASSLEVRADRILRSGALSDATVLVGRDPVMTFRVHKLFLAISSSVLESQLYSESGPVTISMEDTTPPVFLKLLGYIYKNEVKLDCPADTWSLWLLAQKLKMKHLGDKTREYIIKGVTPDNALQSLKKAALYSDTALEQPCFRLIEKYADRVLKMDEFADLPENLALKIISSPYLQATEIVAFDAAVAWAKRGTFSEETIQQRFSIFKPHIRLDAITSQDFQAKVMTSGVLSDRELIFQMGSMISRMNKPGKGDSGVLEQPRSSRVQHYVCDRSSQMKGPSEPQVWSHYNAPVEFKFAVVRCPESCLFTGMQITQGYNYYDSKQMMLQIDCVVEEKEPDGRTLYLCAANSLKPPYSITFDSPIQIKAGSEYSVQVTVHYVDQDARVKSFVARAFEQVTCGDVLQISFTPVTNAKYHLVPRLFFESL